MKGKTFWNMIRNRSVSESDGDEINYIAHQNVYYTNSNDSGNGTAPNIDGRENCILIRSKLPDVDIAYPVGCHITIAGRGTMFMIVE